MADELRLCLMRQDFLWHTPSAGADTKERIFNALKQVGEWVGGWVSEWMIATVRVSEWVIATVRVSE